MLNQNLNTMEIKYIK